MSKQKKKRNKIYTGVDAAVTKPIITRISATNRSKIGQWWFEHKKIIRTMAVTAAIVLLIIVVIIGIVRTFFIH